MKRIQQVPENTIGVELSGVSSEDFNKTNLDLSFVKDNDQEPLEWILYIHRILATVVDDFVSKLLLRPELLLKNDFILSLHLFLGNRYLHS